MTYPSELLEKLHLGFIYMNSHPGDVETNQSLIERSKPIIEELETFGIPEQVSLDTLLMGIPIKELGV